MTHVYTYIYTNTYFIQSMKKIQCTLDDIKRKK
jgi:hypothetical protein